MLGSKFLDLVLGVDIHIQMVPAPPSPVPVPALLPSPFIGMIFDPVTAAAMVLGPCPLVTAMAVAMDPIGFVVNMAIDKLEGVNGDQVLINGMVATTTMTQPANRWVSPHTPTPPALLFFNSGKPVPVLMGDAVYNLGSSSVWINSRRAVRAFIDPAFTCSEPLRLPTGITMPVPLGAPVLIGGFPCPDIQAMISRAARAAITGAIKAAVNKPLTAAIRRLPPGRLRTILATAKCHCTGDPIDVATGRMFSTTTDWELPGPIPLNFTREYSSAVSDRDGVLGYGWSHVLDEEVWLERGRVVYRAGDGREIQFDTVHLPERKVGIGDEIFESVNRLWLRCVRDGFDVRTAEGRVHELRCVRGDRRSDRWRLVRIRSRDLHEIALDYDEYGRLTWVRDSEGRMLRFEHDRTDRLIRISLPHPTQPGFVPHVSYEYSASGNLMAVRDALGNVSRYDYSGHLMVQRTGRTGLSFYFGYDGIDSTAYCVRTWGDGGIYDHELVYDKEGRRTFVTNSLGATTVYTMNEALFVEKVTDAHAGTTEYAYDELLRTVKEVGPSGETTEFEYDARGNCVRASYPGGVEALMEYNEWNLPTRVIDALGAERRWDYDGLARIIRTIDALGGCTTYFYDSGRVSSVCDPGGQLFRFTYDPSRRIESATLPDGATLTCRCDALGRVVEEWDARGAVTHTRYNALGDVETVMDANGLVSEYRYDGEGHVVEERDPSRHVQLTYAGFHKVVAREEAGTRLVFDYDTEEHLVAIVNEHGERYEYTFDALGDVTTKRGFDGFAWTYMRDMGGRVTRAVSPSGQTTEWVFDAAGRQVAVKSSDGTGTSFVYDAVGRIVEARNESSHIVLERDALGRVIRESQDGGRTWVRCQFNIAGERHRLESDHGASLHVEFDRLGRVRALADGSEVRRWAVRYERDPDGRRIAQELPGGVRISWTHDGVGRPTDRFASRQRDVTGTGTPRSGPAWGSSDGVAPADALESRSYQWSGRDELTALVSSESGPIFYDYDARGRLVRERRTADQSVVPRAIDEVGNVYRSEDGHDRRYGPGGRIDSANGARFVHDAEGNLRERIEADGRKWIYHWNSSGRLVRVDGPGDISIRYEYDAFARRTRKSSFVVGEDGDEKVLTDVRFVWDGHTVLHELDGLRGVVTWYWEPGTVTPVLKEHGERWWTLASDHLGTPTEMYDALGELAWKMQFDVFGVPRLGKGSADDCPWRWPGQYEDRETGEYYNRARYYSTALGRYISVDPIGLAGGTALYGYVPAPTTQDDPFGLDWNYRLRDAAGNVYYYGRASDNDTPEGVERRHARTEGNDGHRFVRGSDTLEPITPRGTGRSTARGVEQLGVAGDPEDASTAIGRRATNGGRVRGNNIRGVDPNNPRRRGYMAAGRRFLTLLGFSSVGKLPGLTREEWEQGRKKGCGA